MPVEVATCLIDPAMTDPATSENAVSVMPAGRKNIRSKSTLVTALAPASTHAHTCLVVEPSVIVKPAPLTALTELIIVAHPTTL